MHQGHGAGKRRLMVLYQSETRRRYLATSAGKAKPRQVNSDLHRREKILCVSIARAHHQHTLIRHGRAKDEIFGRQAHY